MTSAPFHVCIVLVLLFGIHEASHCPSYLVIDAAALCPSQVDSVPFCEYPAVGDKLLPHHPREDEGYIWGRVCVYVYERYCSCVCLMCIYSICLRMMEHTCICVLVYECAVCTCTDVRVHSYVCVSVK